MRPVVIIPAPTGPASPNVTGWTIGIVGTFGAFGVGPACFWLARVGGWL